MFVCEFCGQAVAVMADSEDEARQYARETCDCGGAARWRTVGPLSGLGWLCAAKHPNEPGERRAKRWQGAEWRHQGDAHKGVEELLVTDGEVTLPAETVGRVKTLCEWIVDGTMAGASFKLHGGITLTAKRNGQGELGLTLKQSQQRQVTV